MSSAFALCVLVVFLLLLGITYYMVTWGPPPPQLGPK